MEIVGNYVKFAWGGGRKKHWGRVCSIEKGVANIRGIEQRNREKPAYHLELGELQVLTHDEVFEIAGGNN